MACCRRAMLGVSIFGVLVAAKLAEAAGPPKLENTELKTRLRPHAVNSVLTKRSPVIGTEADIETDIEPGEKKLTGEKKLKVGPGGGEGYGDGLGGGASTGTSDAQVEASLVTPAIIDVVAALSALQRDMAHVHAIQQQLPHPDDMPKHVLRAQLGIALRSYEEASARVTRILEVVGVATKGEAAVPELAEVMEGRFTRYQKRAAEAAFVRIGEKAVPSLAQLFTPAPDHTWDHVLGAAAALAKIPMDSGEHVSVAVQALHGAISDGAHLPVHGEAGDRPSRLRRACISALQSIGSTMTGNDGEVVQALAAAKDVMGPPGAVDFLMPFAVGKVATTSTFRDAAAWAQALKAILELAKTPRALNNGRSRTYCEEGKRVVDRMVDEICGEMQDDRVFDWRPVVDVPAEFLHFDCPWTYRDSNVEFKDVTPKAWLQRLSKCKGAVGPMADAIGKEVDKIFEDNVEELQAKKTISSAYQVCDTMLFNANAQDILPLTAKLDEVQRKKNMRRAW